MSLDTSGALGYRLLTGASAPSTDLGGFDHLRKRGAAFQGVCDCEPDRRKPAVGLSPRAVKVGGEEQHQVSQK